MGVILWGYFVKFQIVDEDPSGYDWRRDEFNSVVPPMEYRGRKAYVSVTFGAPNAAELADRFAGRSNGYTYMGMGKRGNPTVYEFEREVLLTETDDTEHFDACAYGSGSSAVFLLITYLLRKKKDPVTGKYDTIKRNVVGSPYIYGGTHVLLSTILNWYDMEFIPVADPDDPASWEAAITPNTMLLWCESSSNPHGKVADIRMIAEVGRRNSVPLAVDNTVPTGALCRPLDLGADFVVLSATKMLGGHATVGCGVVIGEKTFMDEFRAAVQCIRPVLDPRGAIDMLIGLSDLEERAERHSENTYRLTRALSVNVDVERVHYAFLPGHPEYPLAATQMKGVGPLFSFTLRRWFDSLVPRYTEQDRFPRAATLEETQRFIDMLTEDGLIPLAVHIGHDRTLATHPASTSHARVPKPDREQIGLTDNMIRVSVGSESMEDFDKVLERFLQTLESWAASFKDA
jgi:cystathionine beta-lyase/cystathionine gamma-synthase